MGEFVSSPCVGARSLCEGDWVGKTMGVAALGLLVGLIDGKLDDELGGSVPKGAAVGKTGDTLGSAVVGAVGATLGNTVVGFVLGATVGRTEGIFGRGLHRFLVSIEVTTSGRLWHTTSVGESVGIVVARGLHMTSAGTNGCLASNWSKRRRCVDLSCAESIWYGAKFS